MFEIIKEIMIEHRQICDESDWSEKDKQIRAIYDSYRIENKLNNIKQAGI